MPDRTINVSRPGTYLVFDEQPGAADPDLPPMLSITVIDPNARNVPVEPLIAPGTGRGAVPAYRVPPNEGRAIARFTAPREGPYLLSVEQLNTEGIDPAGYQSDLSSTIAVGRQLSWSWLRSPLGLLVLGVLPMLAGVAVVAAGPTPPTSAPIRGVDLGEPARAGPVACRPWPTSREPSRSSGTDGPTSRSTTPTPTRRSSRPSSCSTRARPGSPSGAPTASRSCTSG